MVQPDVVVCARNVIYTRIYMSRKLYLVISSQHVYMSHEQYNIHWYSHTYCALHMESMNVNNVVPVNLTLNGGVVVYIAAHVSHDIGECTPYVITCSAVAH